MHIPVPKAIVSVSHKAIVSVSHKVLSPGQVTELRLADKVYTWKIKKTDGGDEQILLHVLKVTSIIEDTIFLCVLEYMQCVLMCSIVSSDSLSLHYKLNQGDTGTREPGYTLELMCQPGDKL